MTRAVCTICGKTNCGQGHAYTNNNILWKRGGRTRACRECNRICLAKRKETVA